MKKLLVLLLSIVAAFTAIISLTACEAKVDKDGNVTITDGDNNGGSSGGNQGGTETGGSGSSESETSKVSVGLEYALNDEKSGYVVTGIGSCKDEKVVIPSTYKGLPVTSIGDYVFGECELLTSITIHDGITSIGSDPFYYCFLLNNILVSKNNKYYKSIDGNLYSKDGKTLIKYAIGKTDTSFTIPSGVASIEDYAFEACGSLTSITIPDGVISIGEDAFNGCTSLKSITIPNNVTSIGENAFATCESLLTITIGRGVTSIGDCAFEECYRLVEVINKSALSLEKGSLDDGGGVAYYALNIKTNGESDIVNKNKYLFYTVGNKNYLIGYTGTESTLTLPANYNGKSYEINDFAFCGSNIVSVIIPDSVTGIGDYAFWNCTSLTSVIIPDSVTSIGVGAFWYCNSLTSVTIGSGVTSIGYYAFDGCESLTSVTYNGTKAQWGRINKHGSWKSDSAITTINCTDGEIDLTE